jgi:hypothetical protein
VRVESALDPQSEFASRQAVDTEVTVNPTGKANVGTAPVEDDS